MSAAAGRGACVATAALVAAVVSRWRRDHAAGADESADPIRGVRIIPSCIRKAEADKGKQQASRALTTSAILMAICLTQRTYFEVRRGG